jgi:hypothetical protein
VGNGHWGEETGTYSSITSLEAIESCGSSGVFIRRQYTLHDLLRDLPQFIMFILQQDDNACGLGVERAGNVENGVFDDLFDACI